MKNNDISDFSLSMDPAQRNRYYRYLSRVVGFEIANMAKACHLTKLTKYWKDMYYLTNFDESEIKRFKSRLPRDVQKREIFIDKHNIFVMINMIHCINSGDFQLLDMVLKFYGIKSYSHLIHMHFPKYCKDDIWNLTLSEISERHLYKAKRGIPNAVLYILDEQGNKELKRMNKNITIDNLSKLIYNIRSRIWQSVKAFANLYYKLDEENKVGISSEESGSGEDKIQVDSIQLVSERISSLICTYSQIDEDSVSISIKKSGLKKETGISIISEISDNQYRMNIKFLLVLLLKFKPVKEVCVENKRNFMIRKVELGVKVANYTIKEEILKFLYSLEIGNDLKKLNKSSLVIFFVNYITLFLRKRVCY